MLACFPIAHLRLSLLHFLFLLSDSVIVLYVLGFNGCLFCLYLFTPVLLRHSSALFMNLSFLTADFWSILFAVLLFHARLHALYFLAFGVIVVGLVVYNLATMKQPVGQALAEFFGIRPPSHTSEMDGAAQETENGAHDERHRTNHAFQPLSQEPLALDIDSSISSSSAASINHEQEFYQAAANSRHEREHDAVR